MLFTLSISILNNKISSSKADKFTFYIIYKIIFVNKVDNNNGDFKFAFCNHIYKASKLFIKSNKI